MRVDSEGARTASAPGRALSGSRVPSFLRSDVLGQTSFLLFFDPALARGRRDAGLDPRTFASKRPSKQFRKAFDGVGAIELLASRPLRNDSQHAVPINPGRKLFHDGLLLPIRKRCRRPHIKCQRNAAADLVDILPTGPSASRSGEA